MSSFAIVAEGAPTVYSSLNAYSRGVPSLHLSMILPEYWNTPKELQVTVYVLLDKREPPI